MNRPNKPQPKIKVKKKKTVQHKPPPQQMGGYIVNGTEVFEGIVLPIGFNTESYLVDQSLIDECSEQIDDQLNDCILNDPLVELDKMIEAEKVETRPIDRFTDFLQ